MSEYEFARRVRDGIIQRLTEFEEKGLSHYAGDRPISQVEQQCHDFFLMCLKSEDFMETSLEVADIVLQLHHRAIETGDVGLHHDWANVLAAIILYVNACFWTFDGTRHLLLLLAEERLDIHGLGPYRHQEV